MSQQKEPDAMTMKPPEDMTPAELEFCRDFIERMNPVMPAIRLKNVLASIRARETACWSMAAVFLENRDAHGVMDMGAELQALQRARMELGKVNGMTDFAEGARANS